MTFNQHEHNYQNVSYITDIHDHTYSRILNSQTEFEPDERTCEYPLHVSTPVYSPENFNHFQHNYSNKDALLLFQEHSDDSCDIPCNITINDLSNIEHSGELCDVPVNIPLNDVSTIDVPFNNPLNYVSTVDAPFNNPLNDVLTTGDVPFNIPLNDVSTIDVPFNNPLNDVSTIDVPFNNPLNDVSTTGLDVTSNSMLQDTGSLVGHGSGDFRVVSFKDALQLSQVDFQLSQDH